MVADRESRGASPVMKDSSLDLADAQEIDHGTPLKLTTITFPGDTLLIREKFGQYHLDLLKPAEEKINGL